MKTTPQPTAAAFAFAQENWPAEGPIHIRLDAWGNAIGWRNQPYTGTGARAIQSEAAAAATAWKSMQVGDTITVPVGWHPRHGAKTETWIRVR
jgi:hypothetical protein